MGMTQTVTVNAKMFIYFFCFCGFHTVGVLRVSLSLWDGVMMSWLTLHALGRLLKVQKVKWYTCFGL